MDQNTNRRQILRWLSLVFLVSLVFRVLWVFLTESYSHVDGDSVCRLSATKAFVVGELDFFTSVHWLPLHFTILAIPSYLGVPLELGGRLLTAILGAGLCLLSYVWNRQFLSSRTAIVAALSFALWPQSIYLSSMALSEIPFVLFLLGGVLSLTRVSPSSRPLFWLYVSAILFTASNMIRFEGWLWSLVFSFALLVPSPHIPHTEKRDSWLRLALLWGLIAIYPLYSMMISAWKNQGDPTLFQDPKRIY